jgi:hypothetical protein
LFVLAAGVWPAHANIDGGTVKVTSPASAAVISGAYSSTGSPTNFRVTLKGQAQTTCEIGFASVSFRVTGPAPTQTFPAPAPNSTSFNGSPANPWDTQVLPNGDYVVRLDVTEKSDGLRPKCNGQTASGQVGVKVANPAPTPEWSSPPAAQGPGGQGPVRFSFKKITTVDIKEYRVVRDGPDGTRTAVISPTGCPQSGNVYTCEDNFTGYEYTGSYNYRIYAVRSAPSGTGQACTTGSSARCVLSSSSDISAVSLTAPPPPPTPTPSPDDDPSSSPSPTTGPTGGSTGRPSTTPTRTLSFGNTSSGGGSASEFYTGTYSSTLPYEATKSLLVPSGTRPAGSPQASGYDAEITSQTAPNFRTVMLPVAGGLLAFLSAAHVRRLLTNI